MARSRSRTTLRGQVLCAAVVAAMLSWHSCAPSNPVVVEIGDDAITAVELRDFVEQLPKGLRSPYTGDAARQHYVQSLVDRRLMLLEAHNRGLDTTRAITSAVNNAVRSHLSALYQRQVIMPEVVVDKNEIESRIAEQGYDRERKMHAILVHTREQIDAVIAGLEGGRTFAELAREYSLDKRSASQGGELGFVGIDKAESLNVPRAVFLELPLNQVSEPISAGASWHVVQFVEERPAPMTRVRNQLEEEFFATGLEQAEDEQMERLRARLNVTLHEDGLTRMVDAYRLRNTTGLEADNTPLFSFGTEMITVGEAQMTIFRGAPAGAMARRESARSVLNRRVLTPQLYAYAAVEQGLLDAADLQAYRKKLTESMLLETLRRQETEIVDVSEIEARQFYDDFPEQFVHERSVWAEELLLATEAEAIEVRRLVEEGADLAELASRSLRPDAEQRGARHHYHPMEVALYPRLIPALLAAERGVLMGPLEVDGGWSVFRIAHIDEGGIEPFDIVKRRARALLLRRRQQEALGAFLQHLRDTHSIAVTIHADHLAQALPDEVL